MVAGSKRRKIETIKPLTVTHLENKLKDMNNRNACLIALLYLSGRRVNEVLHLKKSDFKIEDNRISFETFNLKDYRMKQTSDYTIKRYVKRRNFKGRKSKAYEGSLFYRRIRPHFRTDSESGSLLTIFILKRLGYLSQKDYVFKSFRGKNPISYNTVYKIFRKTFPNYWPHVLRHERFTLVFKIYHDDIMTAHRFTFHKRFESNLPYLRKLEEEDEKI